jgi:uroporphyrinogen decarboxylase-like protein
MLTSRERVELALNHQQPDKVPVDLGGSPVTGMHVDSVYLVRQALKLDPPGTPVKVIEPFQMLGEIKPDLMDALGVDVVSLSSPRNFFGFHNEGWKPWTTFGGTPVLVPADFNTDPAPNGDIFLYPEGDKTVPPSGRMPKGGFYFDAIIRQPPLDEDRLNFADNTEEFTLISEADLAYYGQEIERLWVLDKAIFANFGGTSFGDIALVPGVQMKHTTGIRDVEEWYVSLSLRQEYVYKIFERQCEIALANLERIHQVVGNRVTAILVTGTDFGAQNGPFISPKTYRNLFKPFHIEVNNWIHQHTTWKCVIHSCGSIWRLLDDITEAGFDILDPVQTSAAEMDATALKQKYGDRITFWGGGVDTQHTLPFTTPQEICQDVHNRMKIFGPGGGFVWNSIHNVQAGIPTENLMAMFEAIRDYRSYPLK